MADAPVLDVVTPGIAIGWVKATACTVAPSDEALAKLLDAATADAVSTKETPETVARKAAVRDMLRWGSYKPTGRGKPASEYLLNAAIEGSFPRINNVVDINNFVSVESLLPISLVDLDRAGTTSFRIRRGREGEEYVFNHSGQILALRDLLLAATLPANIPCATPIKDCQTTKTHEGTRQVLGLIYAPASLATDALRAATRMAELLRTHCGGEAEAGLVRPPAA